MGPELLPGLASPLSELASPHPELVEGPGAAPFDRLREQEHRLREQEHRPREQEHRPREEQDKPR
jgi:hypothetical protein